MSITNTPPRGTQRSSDGAGRSRDVLLLGGLFGFVIIGIIGLAVATGWEETLQQFRKLTLWQVLALLGLSVVNYLFRGLRWHLFARRLGLDLTLAANLRHFIGGFAMSVTPGRVGELVRMRWIARETGWSFERTAPLVLIDRASDLIAMALILALAIVLSAAGIAGAVPVVLIALIAAFVATRPALLSGLATGMYRLIGRWGRLFAKVRRASASLQAFTHPWVLSIAAVLGLIGWLAEGVAFYALLTWMGAEIGLWAAVAIFVFATLAGGMTGAPGGVGGAEGAMIGLLLLEGVPLEMSLPATLIIRLTTLWFAIGIGLLVFPLAERQSTRGAHALERR
ncbi:Integral membrane protein [Candidatus Rhodobacter oscarellae]|uniref:Integral membrane protein n=1 Tax=Candidatus Rhodobacter oscarellae TaxID=1675527 RepID=A0A0J9E9R0_9RHOB|nr:lysylphosphatidylglycerol synthase transmembrane domain-containing protein [Candidatus Rhodobacter lobularis]KMW59532.1 Integral membrane protein [Candidatus Rhodobacter lobularis]